MRAAADEARTVPVGPREALRLVTGVAARIAVAVACGLLVNVAGYALVAAPLASRCGASGGIDCAVSIALALALLLGAPAVYAAVGARAAVLGALRRAVLERAAGASEGLLRPIAEVLVARLAKVSRKGTRVAASIDEYPSLLRGAVKLALLLTGLARLAGSAAYAQAMSGADPAAEVTRLLRRDLGEAAARRRSAFPWWLVGVNVAVLAAAWAVVAYAGRR